MGNSNRRWVFLIAGIFIGMLWIYLTDYKYQGKSAKEWAAVANSNYKAYSTAIIRAAACEKDPQSEACNPMAALYKAPTPLPRQTNIVIQEPSLPSYCYSVIQIWLNNGYNRSQANQMMKRDYPECAY